MYGKFIKYFKKNFIYWNYIFTDITKKINFDIFFNSIYYYKKIMNNFIKKESNIYEKIFQK